jgi:hypothetical protein
MKSISSMNEGFVDSVVLVEGSVILNVLFTVKISLWQVCVIERKTGMAFRAFSISLLCRFSHDCNSFIEPERLDFWQKEEEEEE